MKANFWIVFLQAILIGCHTVDTRKTLHPQLELRFDADDSTKRTIIIFLAPYEDAESHKPIDSTFRLSVSGNLSINGRDTLLQEATQAIAFNHASLPARWKLPDSLAYTADPVTFVAMMKDVTGHAFGDTLVYP